MFNNAPELTIERGNHSRLLLALAIAVSSLIALIGSLSFLSIKAGLSIVTAWTALIWICIYCLRKRFDRVVMAWLVVFPFCYYFFSFPRERSVFTVDRAFLLLVVLTLISAHRSQGVLPLRADVRLAAYLWAAYLSVCFVSLLGHPVFDILGSYRLILDGMLLPALLGLYAIRFFPIAGNLKRLHTCICILMLSIATVTGIELFSGINLFPWPGAVEEWVQTNGLRIIRVDGPFENSSVLCLVGTLGFFLLTYCRRLINETLTGRRRLLHSIGAWAALASALMPMNRGLVIALLLCACIDYFAKESLISHGVWNVIAAILLLFVVFAKLFYPDVYADRVSRGDNVYQRIAQNQQTLEVIRDNPLLGVGLNLYHDAVIGDPKYTVQWRGFGAMDIPHNSLFTVLAEEGFIGFFLYVAAQVVLVRAMWKMRKVNRLGWRVFLYCILVYTIFGLDAGIVYYSDLNLFYMFVLGVIVQIQLRMLPGEPTSNDLRHR